MYAFDKHNAIAWGNCLGSLTLFLWNNARSRGGRVHRVRAGFDGAVMNQLVPTLDAMASAPLSLQNAQALPDAQGVYLLIYDGEVR